jgi:hypothetical protein
VVKNASKISVGKDKETTDSSEYLDMHGDKNKNVHPLQKRTVTEYSVEASNRMNFMGITRGIDRLVKEATYIRLYLGNFKESEGLPLSGSRYPDDIRVKQMRTIEVHSEGGLTTNEKNYDHGQTVPNEVHALTGYHRLTPLQILNLNALYLHIHGIIR